MKRETCMICQNAHTAVNGRTITFIALVCQWSIAAANANFAQVHPTIMSHKLVNMGIMEWKPIMVNVLNMIQYRLRNK
jgi:hypothetical protein